MKSDNGPDLTRVAVLAGFLLLIVLFLLRIHPPTAFMAFAIGSTVGFFFLGGRLTGYLGGRDKPKDKGVDHEFHQRIADRLADCRKREERFRDEGERIMKSIATLRDDLNRNAQVDAAARERAKEVIAELEAEFSLRHTKASFFAECADRLRELLDRHRLVESIAARRRELRQLQRNNFDDEAVAEETRYHIEQDTIELDTIVELSNSAVGSSKAEQAEALRSRLEQLRHTLSKGRRRQQN